MQSSAGPDQTTGLCYIEGSDVFVERFVKGIGYHQEPDR